VKEVFISKKSAEACPACTSKA